MTPCNHTQHRTIGYLDNEPVPWCEDCGAYKHEHLWVRPTMALHACAHPDGMAGAYGYFTRCDVCGHTDTEP